MNFTRLVLSTGGIKGLAILGALQYIDECGGLKNISEYWGSSIGSVLCVLLSIGYTPFEIFHQFFVINRIIEPHELEWNPTMEALCPIETIGQKMNYLIEQKLASAANLTFADLYAQFQKKVHLPILQISLDSHRSTCR